MILRLFNGRRRRRRRRRKILTPEMIADLAENTSVFKIGVYL